MRLNKPVGDGYVHLFYSVYGWCNIYGAIFFTDSQSSSILEALFHVLAL